ncbi:DUF3891 family protein [Paenibacillus sp. 1001270B_150601_E10]|uniref:DUF3891 family protein n=1 Tax=Paenibacillus sp. 1001270B_150601_E10 TaxID=2787079 RepID=UPI00189CD2BF|nr:DUF3891 family protein [Paenibacillus sp. 1001270B_150601_E10]
MIVRETELAFIMVEQHEHAQLSGDVARQFKNFFVDDPFFNDLVFAVYHHDLGWKRLDDTPIWNDHQAAPFSFMDYPLLPKLTHYQYGLDQTEQMNKYAALLCSLHYSSFGLFKGSSVEESNMFIHQEDKRQQRIKAELNLNNHEDINKPFRLLQLCDAISLYVCLYSPGVDKEQENPWYKNGFKDSEPFNDVDDRRLVAEWISSNEIKITPNPFDHSFHTLLKQKRVSKALINEVGIGDAYKQSEWFNQEVVFVGRSD